MPSIAFLQAVRRALSISESAGSGDFIRRLSVGNSMGRHSRALSQLRSRQRESSRMPSAVTEKLSVYAAAIFSSAVMASRSLSISRLQ